MPGHCPRRLPGSAVILLALALLLLPGALSRERDTKFWIPDSLLGTNVNNVYNYCSACSSGPCACTSGANPCQVGAAWRGVVLYLGGDLS